MKKKHAEKKLKISRETLMNLNEKELREAVAMSGRPGCVTFSCECPEN